MSLQAKFGLLLLIFGLSIVSLIAVSWWSLGVVDREGVAPLEETPEMLQGLAGAREGVSALRELMERADGDRTVLDEPGFREWVVDRERVVTEQIRRAGAMEWSGAIGGTQMRQLPGRVESAMEGVLAWADGGPGGSTAEELRSIEGLIQMVEYRILENASIASESVVTIRTGITRVLGAALVVAALGVVLGVLLVRRWVLIPISRVRDATARIATGDFDHRVAVRESGDEVNALSHDINNMTAMLHELQERAVERERLAAVGEMVRRITHNLRNPLAGIRSLAELSVHELPEDSEVCGHQRRIIASVDRFEHWLSSLLRVTRPTEVCPVEGEPGSWLASISDVLSTTAESRGVRLEVETGESPRVAVYDASHLEQAVVALVTNAIEVSPSGGVVRVEAVGGSGTWSIRVTDEGPGVEESVRETLFKPYVTTKKDGSGIGLAVASQIVSAHGGRVEVLSRAPEPGTSFVIILPNLLGGGKSAVVSQNGAFVGQNSAHRG